MPESARLVHSSCHATSGGASLRVGLGADALDRALNGGLARGRLHELWPAHPSDLGAATGFALMLARLAAGPTGTIVYLAEARGAHRAGALHGPGLVEIGVDPARLVLVEAPDARELLRVAADVVRSPAVAAAVLAPARPTPLLDLTAGRRLTLFAERSGATALLLAAADPAQPSAAATRWRVAAAPSVPLDAGAPGHPAFLAELVRQRGGPPAPPARLEWRRDLARFTDLSQPVAAVAGGGRVARA